MKPRYILALLLLLVAGLQSIKAQEAYTVFVEADSTLTFYYDDNRASRTGTTYSLNTEINDPDWYENRYKISKVVFDPSFADARPTTTYSWFYEMVYLSNIVGLSYLNTSEVTNMGWMFGHCIILTSLDLSTFDTSNVTKMNSMFNQCFRLRDPDLSNFNTEKVTSMGSMFYLCVNLRTLDLRDFNTEKVTDMYQMFQNCYGLNRIIVGSGWSTASVNDSYRMFDLCEMLVGEQGTTYDENHTDASYAHVDGGPSDPGYFCSDTFVEYDPAYAVFTEADSTLTFYYDDERNNRSGTAYSLNKGVFSPDWSMNASKITKVVFDPSFAEARPTTTAGWFYDMKNLTSIMGMSYFNTSEVTEMFSMFYGCSGLTDLDLSNFNTEKVTDMYGMFYGCSSLTCLDLSSFYTENVTDMTYLFNGCNNLTSLDLRNFNTANVTGMNCMFRNCYKLERIYVGSEWSTEKVRNSGYMFQDCTKLAGQQGTTFDASHVEADYAHIDGGTDNPGYFCSASIKLFAFEKDGIYYVYGWDNEAGQNGPGSNHVFVVPRDELYNTYSGDVVVPGTVTYNGRTYDVAAIMDESFKDCTELTSVTLPETSIGIEIKVFAGCTALQTVICTSTTPPYLTGNTFTEDHYQSVIVIVPTGTKATYQAADYWKNFANIVEPSEPDEPKKYVGYIWQEYTTTNGELYEANETGKTLTIAPSAETPGKVNIGYPVFKMAGSNEKLNGFDVNGVPKYEESDGTIYYALTEPKRMQIRGRTSILLCDVTLVGVQPSPISMPVLKLILTGVRTQFEGVIWFGYGPDLDRIKALLEDVDDFITGVEAVGQQTTDNGQQNIYNLAGQRLSKPQKGINIINGKKVLIK